MTNNVPDFFADASTNENIPNFFEEDNKPIVSKEKGIWSNFGKSLAMQTQSGGFSGFPTATPEQAKKIATDVIVQEATGAIFKPVQALVQLSKLRPFAKGALRLVTGLTQSATTGAAIPTAEALVDGREIPTKEELLKEGALWAGIDLALQGLGFGTRFGRIVNTLSKENGISRRETINRLYQGAKKYYGWKPPKVDPKTGTVIIDPEQITNMVNLAEKNPEILVGKGEIVKKEPEVVIPKTIEEPKPVVAEEAPNFFPPEETKVETTKAKENNIPDLQTDVSPKKLQEQKDFLINKLNDLQENPEKGEKVTIKVPGDGVFKLNNTPANLEYFEDRVNKLWPVKPISTKLGEPLKAKKTKPSLNKKEKEVTPNIVSFETSKGSTYEVDEHRTTRNKAERPEHPNDKGLKPKSQVTHYVTPENAVKLGLVQTEGPKKRLIQYPSSLGVQYLEGKDKGKVEKGTVVDFKTVPEIGLIPIESWNNGKDIHFGNKIIKVSTTKDKEIPQKQVEIKKSESPKKEIVKETEKPKLTEQQIRNRELSKKRSEARDKEKQVLKTSNEEQTNKEREVAFKNLGIDQPKEASKEIKETLIPDNEDALEAEALDEEILSDTDKAREQSFAERQYLNDKIASKMTSMFSKIDVEAPFRAVNAPKTGKAVKLFFDTRNAYTEEAKGLIKELGDLKLTKDQLWDSFLAAETNKSLTDPNMTKARDLFRDYFDKSFAKYKQEGGLTLPWPQSAISRLEKTIDDLQTKLTLPNIQKQITNKINREIIEIRKTIGMLNNLKYIPKSASLITKALVDSLSDIKPKYISKFAISAHKKRTTGALADWIEKEPKIKEVLHPLDFIGDYANKKGRDIGLLRIVKGAIEEGLAVKGEKIGFKNDPFKFPALAGYNLHPSLFEYIENLTRPIPFNVYDKISRLFKTAIVFDPTYIGTIVPYFRTLIQNPKFLIRIPKYWKKAINDLINRTPEYIKFIDNGGASNPYPATRDFENWLDKEKLNNGSPVQILFNQVLTKVGAKDLMNKIGNFSWILDRVARMAYYNMLVDKGLSVGDAAKLSAENFVDYSKLPAKTSRWLGRVFFAPVTQLLSMVNDVALTLSPIRLVKEYVNDKQNFKNDNINKERMGLFIGSVITLAGISALMKSFGFKEEEFGTKYTAEYTDKDGKKKEVAITPTHSLNYSLRWINTFWRGFGAGESSPTQKIWGRLKGQLGPVPNLLIELGENKTRDGKHIWDSTGDDYASASWKIAKHIVKKAEPFVWEKLKTTKERQDAHDKIKEMMGWGEFFMDSIEFFYEQKPKSTRIKNKISNLKREMSKIKKEGKLTEKAHERYIKAIDDLKNSKDR